MKCVLYVPYFKAASAARQKELDVCVEKNTKLTDLDKIYLIIDDDSESPVISSKINIVKLEKRPTYQDWIRLTYKNDQNCVSLLANADIYFEKGLEILTNSLRNNSKFLALSRYDLKSGNLIPHANPRWSQDVWGLCTSNQINTELFKELDFMLGVPRCDNKVAYLFSIYGWSLINPMSSVVSVHVHETEERTYNKKTDVRILGGVAYVEPCEIAKAELSNIEYDIYGRIRNNVTKVNLSKFINKLEEAEWQNNQPIINFDTVGQSLRSRKLREGVPNLNYDCENDLLGLKNRLLNNSTNFSLDPRFSIKSSSVEISIDDILTGKSSCFNKSEFAHFNDDKFISFVIGIIAPPVVDISPIKISEDGISDDKISFWQYPSTTELQALKNHRKKYKLGDNVDLEKRIVNVYLGLPWATFIDRKITPNYVEKVLAVRLKSLRRTIEKFGFCLNIHTVCQTIHWMRLVPLFDACGITDLHLSHLETHSQSSLSGVSSIKLHSWPLIATNIEVSERRDGLVFGKPITKRKWFATFKGAHMKHYRSDVRLRLADAVKTSNRNDIFVEVKNEWHFNKAVYKEQVNLTKLTQEEMDAEREQTRSYNEMLSDSVFSLCPEGAGPNTIRFWESLAVGAIPVVLADKWIEPDLLRNNDIKTRCYVKIDSNKCDDFISILEGISVGSILKMSENCKVIYELASRLTCF